MGRREKPRVNRVGRSPGQQRRRRPALPVVAPKLRQLTTQPPELRAGPERPGSTAFLRLELQAACELLLFAAVHGTKEGRHRGPAAVDLESRPL